LAQSDGVSGSSTIGRVDAVYVREARGLYYEKKLMRGTEQKEAWVEVHFASSPPVGPESGLFKVPANISAERGDLVATRNGDATPSDMHLLPDVGRVTALVATHGTPMAMNFDNPDARRVPGLYTAARARSIPAATFVAYSGIYTGL
jgi:hypothetical protein